MFEGESSSPELDVTWRRHRDARFPMFIFEIESLATKSSSDNAVKVFSRKTSTFAKPLFFFHIFLDASIGAGRINYLKENFDKLNYEGYLFEPASERLRFFRDVLDQHMRLETYFALYEVLQLIRKAQAFPIPLTGALDLLIEREYDLLPESDFLVTLEAIIIDSNDPEIREYYLSYLPDFLCAPRRPRQCYAEPSARAYSTIIHHAILVLVDPSQDRKHHFQRLRALEVSWSPWPLWDPNFGLSQDHDLILLSEFPVLLTILCAAFAPDEAAGYFSGKLREILAEIKNYSGYNLHGLIWLLIASRISGDRDSYEFARSTINRHGGIPPRRIATPSISLAIDFPTLPFPATDCQPVVSFEEWSAWIGPYTRDPGPDLLWYLLDGMLIMRDGIESRAEIAMYCLHRASNI
ncbi:MAG: hypothetical protein LC667_02010 [Thioalkalivibrio sp.]|nr:hypothetical protein [Thioalkalivibrio sp.]